MRGGGRAARPSMKMLLMAAALTLAGCSPWQAASLIIHTLPDAAVPALLTPDGERQNDNPSPDS